MEREEIYKECFLEKPGERDNLEELSVAGSITLK
jgi:hypothetical protein